MPPLRWGIRDLFLLVAIVAGFLVAYRYFYPGFEWEFVFAIYLSLLTLSTIAAFRASPRWRLLCQGYSLFGWTYLVLVSRLGIEKVQTFSEGQAFIHLFKMGMIFASLNALAIYVLVPMREQIKDNTEAGEKREP